jgi:hypothetical protein
MNKGEAAFVVAYEERAGAECLRRIHGPDSGDVSFFSRLCHQDSGARQPSRA